MVPCKQNGLVTLWTHCTRNNRRFLSSQGQLLTPNTAVNKTVSWGWVENSPKQYTIGLWESRMVNGTPDRICHECRKLPLLSPPFLPGNKISRLYRTTVEPGLL